MDSPEHDDSSYETNITLAAATQGIYYQIKLMMLLLIRGVKNNCDFKLGTEVKIAGKFDDVTFEFKDPTKDSEFKSVLIQLKHRKIQDKSISLKELLGTDRKGDFNICNYFRSWRKVCEDGCYKHIKNVILYTNIQLHPSVHGDINFQSGAWNDMLTVELDGRKPVQYRLEKENKALLQKLNLATPSYRLAHKLCDNLFSDNRSDIREDKELMRYRGPLCAHVLYVDSGKKKKKNVARLRRDFLANEAVEVKHFREQMKLYLRSCGKSIDEAMEQTMAVPENFGKATADSVQTSLPTDGNLEEEFRKFTDVFILCTDQPSQEELDGIIINEITVMERYIQTKVIYSIFMSQIMDWFTECRNQRKVYYTLDTAKVLLQGLKDKMNLFKWAGLAAEYPSRLAMYNLDFRRSNPELSAFLKGDDRLFHINTSHTLLGAAIALQTWRETLRENDCIFMELSSLLQPGTREAVEGALRTARDCVLILECNAPCPEDVGEELRTSRLFRRRVVLVAGPQHYLARVFTGLESRAPSVHVDLTPKCMERVFEMVVKFQGRPVELSKVVRGNEASHKLLDNGTIEALLRGEDVHIGYELRSSHNLEHGLYINREFSQDLISARLLTDTRFVELLAVTGLSGEELRRRVGPGAQVHSGSGGAAADVTRQFYVLDDVTAERDFRALCESNQGRSVYWIHIDDPRIMLIGSKEGTNAISRFVEPSATTYSEENLLADLSKTHVVISNDAGRGKSTLLGYLARRIAEDSPGTWIFRIDLNEYRSVLEEYRAAESIVAEDVLINKILKCWTRQSHSTYALTDKLLRHCISSPEQRKVVVLLDAVDEVSPDHVPVVIRLMQGLQRANARLVVTGRRNTCARVEKCLGVLAHSLLPLSAGDQCTFLRRHWVRKLGVPEELASVYAEALICRIEDSLHRDFRPFFGIALHTRMLADMFADVSTDEHQGCKQYCDNPCGGPQLPSEEFINDLYEQLVLKQKLNEPVIR